MGKTALIFPGQGAQYVGMAKDFYETFPESRMAFETASRILGLDMQHICFEENDKLNITEYTQAAMVTACTAMLGPVLAKGITFEVCAGLSLGEYMALVATGAVSYEDALKVTRQRGILMQEAVPAGLGAMAAVLGLDERKIEEICNETEGIVTIANYNCPGQIVISGEVQAVSNASEKLKEAGAKRVIPLNVSGPFHSNMLLTAGEKLIEVLDNVEVKKPQVPYVSNVHADYVREESSIKELLSKQVYSSVKWSQSVEKMIEQGVDRFIEIGPGKTLTSFVKKINKEVITINIEKIEDLDKL